MNSIDQIDSNSGNASDNTHSTPRSDTERSTWSPTSLPTSRQEADASSENLRAQLAQFMGTGSYYSLGALFRHAVYTDGVQFLIDHAHCAWLITDAMAWVSQKIPGKNWHDGFMTVSLHPRIDGSADLCITDGNDVSLHTQHYTSTTFPLSEGVKMFAVWGGAPRGASWVLMLTQEY